MADNLDEWGDPVDPEAAPSGSGSLTMNSSTGKNDTSSSSPWYSDLGGSVQSGAKTVGSILSLFNSGGNKTATATPGVAPASSLSKFLPYIIGGVALIVVLPLVLKK